MSDSVRKNQISTLTGLRGFAVILVFISHVADTTLLPLHLGDALKPLGSFGVMLFFILSGYLMTTLYYEGRFQENWRRYVLARIGRVIPLFYLIVGISIFATGRIDHWHYQIPNALDATLHFLCIYGCEEMWAIPVEIQFYLFFIFLWYFSQKFSLNRNSKFLYLGLLGIVGACVVLTVLQRKYWDTWTLNLVIAYFLIGFTLALRQDDAAKFIGFLRRKLSDSGLAVVSIVAVICCLPVIRRPLGLYFPMWFDPTIMLSIALMFLLSLFAVGPYRILNLRAFQFLGTISYGFYLIHSLVLYLAVYYMGGAPAWLTIAVIFGVTTVLSYFSFYYFESPMGKWIRRLESIRPQPTVEDRPASAPQS